MSASHDPARVLRAVVALCVALAAGCGQGPEPAAGDAVKAAEAKAGPDTAAVAGKGAAGQVVQVLERTSQLPTFPCVEQCHKDRMPNPTPRALTEFHSTKKVVHGGPTVWCTRCHNLANLDRLQALDGQELTFDQSFVLCGQCHGDKRRDWDGGIHGLQTGSWSGTKLRRSCTACHDPHAPKRPTFEALPAPVLQRESSHD
jgi:hypothetical protein